MYLSTEGDLTKDPIVEDVLKFNMTISEYSVPYNKLLGINKVTSGTSNILVNANVSSSISSAISRASKDLSIKDLDLETATVILEDASGQSIEVNYAD